MKTILSLLSIVALSACSTVPNYRDAENSEFTKANYSAADNLTASPAVRIDKSAPILVATMVNIDSLAYSSRFGRLVSEQISSRLVQQGFNVVEMKLRNNVYIREGTGELLLSRDVRDLSRNYNSQVVIVGNYATASGYVYLTLKCVTVADNRVIGAVNYVLPITENTAALLKQPE